MLRNNTKKGTDERIRELQASLDEAQARLAEADDTLRALTSGEVDAIVAPGPQGDRVYTLRGADETYRVMVQEMAEGAITLSADGLILFSNEQFATMLRSPLERVIGSRIQDFVAREDAGTVSALLVGTGGGTSRRKAELRLTTDEVAFVPVYLSARSVILNGAECLCLIATDLSAQKRYEEMVAVMEAVPVAVFIAKDAECRSVAGNRMAHELLRMPPGSEISKPLLPEHTSKQWREVRGGRDIPAEELPMRIAARTGQPVRECEFDMVFDDGTSRCWLGNTVPLFDEMLRPRGAVGAFEDITDRKNAGEALETTNAELRNFASAFTHHLREPLDRVMRFTRLLAPGNNGNLSGEAAGYVAGAIAGASEMEALLKALLHYWEVTERRETLSPVDCGHLLSQTLQDLQTPIRESNAVVTSGPLPTVVADEVMLAGVFRNLIDNSVRYRGQAAPEIHVSAVNAGDRWLFSVRDNGIGIDPQDGKRVFGMFNRLGRNLAAGGGIGLTLCRKVVERHGGRIWVESEAGRGAAFRFTLPIYLDSALHGFSAKV